LANYPRTSAPARGTPARCGVAQHGMRPSRFGARKKTHRRRARAGGTPPLLCARAVQDFWHL